HPHRRPFPTRRSSDLILQKLAFGGSACSASSAPPPYLVPTIATAAAASPNPVTTGTTTDLSVLGADDAGEANLTYTWAVTAGPPDRKSTRLNSSHVSL